MRDRGNSSEHSAKSWKVQASASRGGFSAVQTLTLPVGSCSSGQHEQYLTSCRLEALLPSESRVGHYLNGQEYSLNISHLAVHPGISDIMTNRSISLNLDRMQTQLQAKGLRDRLIRVETMYCQTSIRWPKCTISRTFTLFV